MPLFTFFMRLTPTCASTIAKGETSRKKVGMERCHSVIFATILAFAFLSCGDDEMSVNNGVESVGAETPSGMWEGQTSATEGGGILQEILKESEIPRHKDPATFAKAVLRSLYRDGELRGVLDAMEFRHPRCRIGTYSCAAIETLPRRVGALVALLPGSNLKPTGMDAKVFEEKIENSLRLLEPAPDKALPYIPAEGESLFTYEDHHGLTRYLLLERAGRTWRILALASASEIKPN